MKVWGKIVFSLSVLVIGGLSCHKQTEEAVVSNLSFDLEPPQFVKLTCQAMEGDKDAAFRLYGYYIFHGVEGIYLSSYWLEKAAVLGHRAAAGILTKNQEAERYSKPFVSKFPDAILAAEVFDLKADDLVEKICAASKGDSLAAYRLYQYYGLFIGEERYRSYWLREAAALGDGRAEVDLETEFDRFIEAAQ